jgi:hypothetical protein
VKNGNYDTVRSFTTDTGWKKSLSIVFGQVRSGQIRNIFLPVHSGVTHIKGHIYEGVLVKRGWTKLAPVIATILIPLYRGLFIESENRAWFYRVFFIVLWHVIHIRHFIHVDTKTSLISPLPSTTRKQQIREFWNSLYWYTEGGGKGINWNDRRTPLTLHLLSLDPIVINGAVAVTLILHRYHSTFILLY